MEIGDLSKVWEIKALKRKPEEEKARKMLKRIANQVQPIMCKRKWKVQMLSEFCPSNQRLLGLNVGGGVEVKLRLRRPNRDCDFIPYEQVLDTMLHELCHIKHGPHNAAFYKLWDEIRKDCEELISKGVTGSGQGFDLPGKHLGGFSWQPPLPALRQTALAAAEKRSRIGCLLPSGPKRLGGDSDIMVALSPIQAAAMAAERRMQDDLWCGSFSSTVLNVDDDPSTSVNTVYVSADSSSSSTISGKRASNATCNNEGQFSKVRCLDSPKEISGSSSTIRSIKDSTTMALSNLCGTEAIHDKAIWECNLCTLFNQSLALICEACGTPKPTEDGSKNKFWLCKFCTLENINKLDKCTACGSWRYSLGPPVSTRGPNHGT